MNNDQPTPTTEDDWEYICPECGRAWEAIMSPGRVTPSCPDCGSDDVICQTVGSSDD